MTNAPQYAEGEYPSPDLPGYEPPPCPLCGSTNVTVDVLNASTFGKPCWIPGLIDCSDCRGIG